MLKKTLTLHTLAALLTMGGLTFTQTNCTQAEKKEVSQESDQAYNDFKDYVATVETKADNAAAATEADYNAETAQLKADFDTKVAAVDRYADQYDDTRRQEIEQLRTRYTTAYDKRDMAWRNRPNTVSSTATGSTTGTGKPGKYYKAMNPAAQLTAANARATYENFVNNVKQNEDKYDLDDWRYINTEWRALDEAYDKVKGDIPARDLAEIQKEKLKYAAFKSFDKTEARTAQGADAVSGEAREMKGETADERSKVGQAARNTASDVKEAGKDVGQGAAKVGSKVGNAVKGAYKEVKSEVKNTDND
ncbi:hypothetical protein SAMN02745146_1713 [Hymenobacter daecheongensis DSM 21074]|uniref:Uncharacterized protein n=1 Tax=Hymenobacter daecheongensis DSM 21074 TaxID=1121955 RepID=A0A1M6EKD5_9BACT|nr:hypothetical protein [Hymenobacter daecheongensis]SHI85738.1 hypothetical protein SAMN02745146_1713 [Hymenobacter daecheongensis DSM 21074]